MTTGRESSGLPLLGLCWSEHRLVHEGGWTIEGNPNGEITFVSPDRTRRLRSRPRPLRPRLPRTDDDPG